MSRENMDTTGYVVLSAEDCAELLPKVEAELVYRRETARLAQAEFEQRFELVTKKFLWFTYESSKRRDDIANYRGEVYTKWHLAGNCVDFLRKLVVPLSAGKTVYISIADYNTLIGFVK